MTKLMVYVNRRLLGQQRDKLYREALRMELAAAGEDLKKLREIARVHIEMAAAGDMQAIKELADRLDGKPTQILEHSDAEGRGFRKVVCEIVHVHETREALERDDPLLIEQQDDPLLIEQQAPLTNGNGRGHR